MLTWAEKPLKGQSKKILSVSYRAKLPHWGEVSVHPHIHHPGEMFLDCFGLGIEMYPLGRTTAEDEPDLLRLAEARLLKALEECGIWCLEALVAIGSFEG